MSLAFPGFLDPYKVEIFLILFFVDGFLIGAAIKKGAVALVYAIIAFVIASFLGLVFFPAVTLTNLWNPVYHYITQIKLGAIYFSSSIAVFVVGLILGLLKK